MNYGKRKGLRRRYAMTWAEISSIEPENVPGLPGGPGGPGGPGTPVCLVLPGWST